MSINSGSASKRRDQDVVKLMMSKYKVEMKEDEGRIGFVVEFCGPKNTPYEDGVWHVRVELPQDYPFRSPSIGFLNRIFHPNVDEHSGSVCLDVINQAWSPMFNLVNVFDAFLPQLLTYPNPSDPLNSEAAAIMLRDSKSFEKRVKEYVQRYASSQRSSPLLSPTCTPTGGPAKSSLSKQQQQQQSSSDRDEDEMSILSENNDQGDDLLADMEL